MKINIYRFILFIFLSAFPANSSALTLVKDAVSKCVIIIPALALEQEKSAAKDLQEYLGKISGAEIEIETETQGMDQGKTPIYIGNCNSAKDIGLRDRVNALKDDGYIIKANSDSMYIIGKDALSTRFGVFGVLEDHLGVRWYMPGDIGEVVPSSKDIILTEREDVCATTITLTHRRQLHLPILDDNYKTSSRLKS